MAHSGGLDPIPHASLAGGDTVNNNAAFGSLGTGSVEGVHGYEYTYDFTFPYHFVYFIITFQFQNYCCISFYRPTVTAESYQWAYSIMDSSRVSTFFISILLIVYGSFRSLALEEDKEGKQSIL